MAEIANFAVIETPCRVWAVSSIHGEARGLAALHEALEPRIVEGDRLVYLGNVLGRGREVRATVDEVLAFRRAFLAIPGNDVKDYAILRGAQEEMWARLFELQFAVNPSEVLEWMLDHGVGATIEAYGGDPREAMAAARQGTMMLNRWTAALRAAFGEVPGHRDFLSSLRQAAYTDDGALIFVNAGLDPERPLYAQNDAFWWAQQSWDRIDRPYFGCRQVVRGYDPARRGVLLAGHTASIDGRAGFGGTPIAALATPADGVTEILEA